MFEFNYGGHKFTPHRRFTPKERNLSFGRLTELLRSDEEMGLSTYEGNYSHKDFYTASEDSVCDIFKCLDNGKLYVPATNELFEWEGEE